MKYYIAVDDLKGLNQYAPGVEEVIAETCEMVSASEIIREFLRSAALFESYRCEGFEQACREVLSNMESKRSMYRQFPFKEEWKEFWDALSKNRFIKKRKGAGIMTNYEKYHDEIMELFYKNFGVRK